MEKLADADVSEEDQSTLLKFLEKKETEYMRLQRHKMGADDFELLTMIGKGAFGEVCILSFFLYTCNFSRGSLVGLHILFTESCSAPFRIFKCLR